MNLYFKALIFLFLLYGCGNKSIKDCNYTEIAEKSLEREARYIWSNYDGVITYLGAHILNSNEKIKLLDLEDYHLELEDYKEIRKAIKKGFPIIELYYEYDGYSKQNLRGASYDMGTYWRYEGTKVGTVYRYWTDYDSCPCGENDDATSGSRWRYNLSTFFGLTPFFRNLDNNPANYSTGKNRIFDLNNVYEDFNTTRIYEYQNDTTSKYRNLDWSEWKDFKDSKFFKRISEDEDSFYSKRN